MKLSSALESTNTCGCRDSRDHWRDAGRMIRTVGLGKDVVWHASVPIFTGPFGRTGQVERWCPG